LISGVLAFSKVRDQAHTWLRACAYLFAVKALMPFSFQEDDAIQPGGDSINI
jgi:hypothetical protein